MTGPVDHARDDFIDFDGILHSVKSESLFLPTGDISTTIDDWTDIVVVLSLEPISDTASTHSIVTCSLHRSCRRLGK